MGFSLQRWMQAVCPDPYWDAWMAEALQPLSLPVAWAWAATRLDLSAHDAVLAYGWAYLENQVMVLLKAMPMGQMAGQRLLRALTPVLARAVEQALRRPWAEVSSAAPMLTILSCAHETQYSRLFRS
jgi:urease accessory protein